MAVTVLGQDGTEQFEDVGHSDDARALLKDYYIGDIHEVASMSFMFILRIKIFKNIKILYAMVFLYCIYILSFFNYIFEIFTLILPICENFPSGM